MYRIICFLVGLFVLSSVLLAQEQIKPNPEFYHTWLQYDLYVHLMSGKTPNEFPSPFNFVAQVYFPENSDRVLIGSFNEGAHYQFKVINKDTIEVFYPSRDRTEFVLNLEKINDKTILDIKSGNKKYLLASLDDAYHAHSGVDYFVNDKFFTGNYIAEEDSNIKITFTSDGRLMGIENFNEYYIHVGRNFFPKDFDSVLLSEIVTNEKSKKVKDHLLLHWKKLEDKLILYNVSPSPEDMIDHGKYDRKVLDKYLTLKKVD